MQTFNLRRITASFMFAVSALAITPAYAQSAAPASAAVLAPADTDWGFGVQTRFMDTSVKAGDDFDQYVNGKWVTATPMPADKSRIGSFTALGDLSEERLRGIMEELTAKKWPAGSAEARVAAAYSAYTNTAAIEAAGMAPAKPYLDRIAAVRNKDDLLALFVAPGFAAPIGVSVDADEKQSDIYALNLGQTGLGLPDRDYYLQDTPRYTDIRAKYLTYLTFVLGKAGYADPGAAAQSVIALETSMARAMWDRTLQRNRDLTYNKLSMAELNALTPDGTMAKVLRMAGANKATYALVAQMPPTAEEIATAKLTPEMTAKLGGGVPETLKLLDSVPLASWKAWLTARFIGDRASVLPKEIDDARFAFYGTTLSGQPQQRARWKRGISAVEGQIGELLGKVYAERYFPPANRAAMNDLVGNLRKAMAANLTDLAWMGPETRKEAMAKLNAFTPKIGAPEKYKTYTGLKISATNPIANQISAERWGWNFQRARIGKPVDRSEWFMLPETVNAYYNPTFNEIVFPAAILQPPFFNLSADPAVNYGGIGAVIGHEIGHGFDDQGAKSDGSGNLRDWWTPKDKANFEALTGALTDQYNAFCPFDDGKTCVNGKLTLGENIGDVGGLSLAYRAYKLSLGGKEAPIIDGTTGDQRFFMGWAQVWRGQAREAIARQFLVVDPHSPPKYRINGVVRNFDEWYKAFNIQPGDKLYLPPEKRIRIW
jgi:putative endopeptidase